MAAGARFHEASNELGELAGIDCDRRGDIGRLRKRTLRAGGKLLSATGSALSELGKFAVWTPPNSWLARPGEEPPPHLTPPDCLASRLRAFGVEEMKSSRWAWCCRAPGRPILPLAVKPTAAACAACAAIVPPTVSQLGENPGPTPVI